MLKNATQARTYNDCSKLEFRHLRIPSEKRMQSASVIQGAHLFKQPQIREAAAKKRSDESTDINPLG
jgi:hypothetical protein